MSSLYLGIHDGTHDAGAALVRDGELIFAAAEEHYCRRKGAGGWPTAAVEACLEQARGPIAGVAFPGFLNPNPGLRMARGVQRRFHLDGGAFWSEEEDAGSRFSQWLQFQSPFPRWTGESRTVRAFRPLLQRKLRREIGKIGVSAPVQIVDHHLAHAAGAYYTQAHDPALVLVIDGVGDGLALSVYRGENGRLTRLDAWPFPHSYGLLYATLTGFLGFRPFRHEGKLTGLAALGDPSAIALPFPFEGPPEARRFTQQFGRPLRPWLEQLRPYTKEDVAAWLQKGLETELCGLLRHWIRQTGLGRVAVAGGVVGNVRLNQRLSEVEGVESLWVYPQMGDGGLAAGAALVMGGPHAPRAMPHLFLGFETGDLETALRAAGLPVERPADLAEDAAARLAAGQVVARYGGAMEYGPRALGNRSILAPCGDRRLPARLNLALSRNDFMPFAPVLLEEDAEQWVEGLAPLRSSARFMTATVKARPELARVCPAVVHADGSLRPQLLRPSDPLFPILAAYRRRTGQPALLNTSFNLHEEPIVRTPSEAIATWRAARLDALILGSYLVAA